MRKKETFIECLSDYRCQVYTIFDKKQFIGYFALKKGEIIEFFTSKLDALVNIIYQIISQLNFEDLKIVINPLHIDLCAAFDKIAQQVSLTDELHFKVYDTKKFLEMLFAINCKFREFKNAKEVYQIGNEIIQISVLNGKFEIKNLARSAKISATFSKQEFVRFALGLTKNFQIKSEIFPVVFGLDRCDLF